MKSNLRSVILFIFLIICNAHGACQQILEKILDKDISSLHLKFYEASFDLTNDQTVPDDLTFIDLDEDANVNNKECLYKIKDKFIVCKNSDSDRIYMYPDKYEYGLKYDDNELIFYRGLRIGKSNTFSMLFISDPDSGSGYRFVPVAKKIR